MRSRAGAPMEAMKRLVLVLAAACGTDPHDVIDCGQAWASVFGAGSASCERACVPMPAMPGAACGSAFDATTGSIGVCRSTFLVSNMPSCCGVSNATPRAVDVVLYTCQ